MNELSSEELEILRSRLKDAFSNYEELAGGKEYRFHHLISVHKYVKMIIVMEDLEEEIDTRSAEVAALFHDIGRSEDINDGYLNPIKEHEGHDKKGAEIVSEFIQGIMEQERIEVVEKIIRNHHSDPKTIEGKVVQDADRLFKYGVQNLWRTFHYAYENGRSLEESVEYFEDVEQERMEEKLEKFHFDSVRKIAEKRLNEQGKVYNRIEKGLNGEDIHN